MKKKLLFVIESLVCAGAEKSLVNLLNTIDYKKYEVDLQLFSYGGEYESLLPPDVNLLPPLEYFEYCKGMYEPVTLKEKAGMLLSRMRYSISIRVRKMNNIQKAASFWKYTHKCFKKKLDHYDVAIAYAQGTPTFYVADCITAKRKLAWVNVTYRPEGSYRKYINTFYNRFDKIVCVSESAQDTFQSTFPEQKHKSEIIFDITNGASIAQMAKLPSQAKVKMEKGTWKLLTVGRLAAQKGYDIALEACKILKEKKIDFCWYVLGRGPMEQEIKNKIREYQIEDCFILLGTAANPYPYFNEANIYVQTSKFEGFGLAIAEARILNIPVVTTRFDAVYAQMVEGENGLVVDLSAQAVAAGVEALIKDPALYSHIVEYQSKEKKGNTDEIFKLYALIGDL